MTIEFRSSPLMREVNQIISSSTPVNFTWNAKLHIGKLNYKPLKVVSIDFLQDFENNYSDVIMLSLSISGGMYLTDIYPYKDQLEITLSAIPMDAVSTLQDTSKSIQTERYAATIKDTGNPLVEGNANFTLTKNALDLTQIFEIHFQLVNKAIQQMRFISVGGNYRKTTGIDVIKNILTNESKKVKVDSNRKPIGVDIADTYNKTVREHVLIPQGTKLVDIPQYIHVKCGGIYASGLGYYMSNNHWYVYPCYDLTRINKAANVLTIINVPPNMFPSIERTYRQNGKSFVIMATGEVKFSDNSEARQLNNGNGVRFADANSFTNGFGNTVNNKTTLNRGSNNTEVVVQSRANKINNAPMSSNSITANPYLEYSKLAANNGAIITLVWENSLPSLIEPGTLCKIMYINNDKIKTISGVVLKLHSYVQLKDKGMISTKYVTRTAISIFCDIIRIGE